MDKNNLIKLDECHAFGHENVQSLHGTTLEFTKENFLTLKGDCILGINCNKSVFDFNNKLKYAIQSGDKIFVEISADKTSDFFFGYGSKKMTLTNTISIVFRKSDYICGRTALINCSKSAKNINSGLVDYMKNPNHLINIIFYNKK